MKSDGSCPADGVMDSGPNNEIVIWAPSCDGKVIIEWGDEAVEWHSEVVEWHGEVVEWRGEVVECQRCHTRSTCKYIYLLVVKEAKKKTKKRTY